MATVHTAAGDQAWRRESAVTCWARYTVQSEPHELAGRPVLLQRLVVYAATASRPSSCSDVTLLSLR